MNGDEDGLKQDQAGLRVGDRLRAAREAQGLTIDDIAESTRIPKRHLQTIERGGYDGLPVPTYSAGFVKTWGRRLGLDGQALAEEFRVEMGMIPGEPAQPLAYEPADPRRTPPAGLAILALLIALVAGLGYLYWRGTTAPPAEIAAAPALVPAPTPQPAVQPQSMAAPGPAPTASPPTGPVVIGASQDVWVKVSDGGKILFMNVLHPGDHFEVPANAAAPLLTTGRPGNTTITVGQTPIPPVGDPGRAAKDVSLKPADLLARVATPPPPVQPPAGAPTPVENSAG